MKAKYNATGNYLEELPGMEAPQMEDYAWYHQFDEAYDTYTAHLASLRTIPCHPSCVGKWSDGQEVEENVDYKVCSAFEFEQGGVYEPMAFPLPVKSEDDLWKEAAEKLALTFFGDEPVGSQGYYAALLTYEGEMEVLKQYFTLTKK